MHGSKSEMFHDITDTVNLQYQSGGYIIYRTRTTVNHMGCEKAEDKSFLIFGEYTFFLLLKSMTKKHDYNVKVIRCPFIKTVPLSQKTAALWNSRNLQVFLTDAPECTLEQVDTLSANKHLLYRITLSYRVGLREHQPENDLLSEEHAIEEEAELDPDDSGSVKVWRVDNAQNHTIEQLLGIDRDTLKQFNKNHTQD